MFAQGMSRQVFHGNVGQLPALADFADSYDGWMVQLTGGFGFPEKVPTDPLQVLFLEFVGQWDSLYRGRLSRTRIAAQVHCAEHAFADFPFNLKRADLIGLVAVSSTVTSSLQT